MIQQNDEERYLKNLFIGTAIFITLSLVFFLFLVVLSGCSYMPEITKAVEDIETEEAVSVRIDREAFQNRKNVVVYVQTKNSEP